METACPHHSGEPCPVLENIDTLKAAAPEGKVHLFDSVAKAVRRRLAQSECLTGQFRTEDLHGAVAYCGHSELPDIALMAEGGLTSIGVRAEDAQNLGRVEGNL